MNTRTTYQRHCVDGADDHGREPEGDDGAAAVQEDGWLVLDGVPLHDASKPRQVHCLAHGGLHSRHQ